MVDCRLKRNRNLSTCKKSSSKKLKCWEKKKGRNDWGRELKNSLITVDVIQETGSKDFLFRRIEYNKGTDAYRIKVKRAQTKPQATKLAKNWMSKHDKC